MTAQSVGSLAIRPSDRWREVGEHGAHQCAGRRPRWRSHTFSDGVHAITLTGIFDLYAADEVGHRVRELIARGTRRLILDVTAACTPSRDEQLLLIEILDGHPVACRIVVVLPQQLAVRELLTVDVAVVHTIAQARLLLDPDRVPSCGAFGRLAPAGALSPRDRHELAVRQSLRWAALAAAAGDYENALACLATVEAIGDRLPAHWEQRRRAWRHATRGTLPLRLLARRSLPYKPD